VGCLGALFGQFFGGERLPAVKAMLAAAAAKRNLLERFHDDIEQAMGM